MAIVTLWAALVFIGLAAAFGVPLVNGITHLAGRLPGYRGHGHARRGIGPGYAVESASLGAARRGTGRP